MKNYKQILEAVRRGVNIALDDFDDEEILTLKNSSVKDLNLTKELIELYDNVIDFGLPSGTLWCKYNLGAKTETELGDYYAWGEIEPQVGKPYNWDTYKFGKKEEMLKYNWMDKLILLTPEDDAAYQNLHIHNFKFHIPTKEEFEELLNYSENASAIRHSAWRKNYNNSGVDGIELISKINGNKLFFPAGGRYADMHITPGERTGFYMTSTLYPYIPTNFKTLIFDSGYVSFSDRYRCRGYQIRPVIKL